MIARRIVSADSLGRIVFAAALAGTLACSDPTDPGRAKRVTASTNQTVFFPGQTVEVTVRNRSGIDLQYPFRFSGSTLDAESRGEWSPIAAQFYGPLAIQFLGAHQSVVWTYTLPPDLPNGTYRFSLPMPTPDMGEAEPRLITPSFEVRPPAV